MKMINKLDPKLGVENRYAMMKVIQKMQIDLDRMYGDLQADGTNAELEALRGAITNLNYLKLKLNNARTPEKV